jgi:hypothetical protein
VLDSRHLATRQPISSVKALILIAFILVSVSSFAQTTDSVHHRDSIKVTIPAEYYRPLVEVKNSDFIYSVPARRFYGDPQTVPTLLEESQVGFSLVQRDQSYGREAFMMTNRTSEPLISSSLNGILPLTDPLTGNSVLNYYPLEITNSIRVSASQQKNFNDFGASDNALLTLEKFLSPTTYSRIRLSQELGNAYSNFEGLFSYNTSEALNLTFALYRRAAGKSPDQVLDEGTFNPRVDSWWIRGQSTYFTPTVDATLFFLYTTAFSGLNGGISIQDSTTDIFDAKLAQVVTPTSYDHRTRVDIMGEFSLSLLSEKERTKLGGFFTKASRRVFANDSAFSGKYAPLTLGDRAGLSLSQPAAVDLGSFTTKALLRGDIQLLHKDDGCACSGIKETRFSGFASDSLFLGGEFGISADGYIRATLSSLSVASEPQPDQFFTNFGVGAAMKLSRYLTVSALYNYARDRASLSPTPTATYSLSNIGGFLRFGVPLAKHDSLAVSVGYLDRNEPEGIVAASDTSGLSLPRFSSEEIRSRSIRSTVDLWFSSFRVALGANYSPSVSLVSEYTTNAELRAPISQKINGSAAFFYEDEISEGNLRLSLGLRTRYMNTLSTALTYDGASDYYMYKGVESLGGYPYNDERLTSPKYILDILATAEVDRRAQINILLYNITAEPFYTVSLYPRSGFMFKIDVTWAFLD